MNWKQTDNANKNNKKRLPFQLIIQQKAVLFLQEEKGKKIWMGYHEAAIKIRILKYSAFKLWTNLK